MLLRDKKDDSKTAVFAKKLQGGQTLNTHWGRLRHDDLIGKRSRSVVTTDKKRELRVYVPSLEEYVTMTPRAVTPVRPKDIELCELA